MAQALPWHSRWCANHADATARAAAQAREPTAMHSTNPAHTHPQAPLLHDRTNVALAYMWESRQRRKCRCAAQLHVFRYSHKEPSAVATQTCLPLPPHPS